MLIVSNGIYYCCQYDRCDSVEIKKRRRLTSSVVIIRCNISIELHWNMVVSLLCLFINSISIKVNISSETSNHSFIWVIPLIDMSYTRSLVLSDVYDPATRPITDENLNRSTVSNNSMANIKQVTYLLYLSCADH